MGRRFQRRQGKRSTLIAQQLPLDNFFGTTLTAADLTNSANANSGEDSSVSPETLLGRVNEKDADESVYEKPTDQVVIHSVNCQELMGCKCTPKSESDRFSEERAAAIRQLHAGRNEQARRRKAGTIGTTGATAHTDDWDPTMEDSEE